MRLSVNGQLIAQGAFGKPMTAETKLAEAFYYRLKPQGLGCLTLTSLSLVV